MIHIFHQWTGFSLAKLANSELGRRPENLRTRRSLMRWDYLESSKTPMDQCFYNQTGRFSESLVQLVHPYKK